MRWWSFRLRLRSWLSAIVLFVGTLFFFVSLVAAFAEDLTPRQSNGWIWLPDITRLRLLPRLRAPGPARRLPRHGSGAAHLVGWWIVAVNQLGSVLFFLAGVAAFTRPATSERHRHRPRQLGDVRRGVCFVVGGVMQAFDTPTPTRTVVQQS